jgi:hypothetical protein
MRGFQDVFQFGVSHQLSDETILEQAFSFANILFSHGYEYLESSSRQQKQIIRVSIVFLLPPSQTEAYA